MLGEGPRFKEGKVKGLAAYEKSESSRSARSKRGKRKAALLWERKLLKASDRRETKRTNESVKGDVAQVKDLLQRANLALARDKF